MGSTRQGEGLARAKGLQMATPPSEAASTKGEEDVG
jgi:hypothetical protein